MRRPGVGRFDRTDTTFTRRAAPRRISGVEEADTADSARAGPLSDHLS